jgi:hypothetical protein
MGRFLKSKTIEAFDGRLQITIKPQTLGLLVEADEFLTEFEALLDDYRIKAETRKALRDIAAEYATLLVATESVAVKASEGLDDTVIADFVAWFNELDLDETDFADLWAARLEMPDWIVSEWSRAYLEAQRLNHDKASAPVETLSEADKESLKSEDSPLA